MDKATIKETVNGARAMSDERSSPSDREQPFLEQVMADLERSLETLERKALARMSEGTSLMGTFQVLDSDGLCQMVFLGVSDSWFCPYPQTALDVFTRKKGVSYWQVVSYSFDVSPEEWEPERVDGFLSWEEAFIALFNEGLALLDILRLGFLERVQLVARRQ